MRLENSVMVALVLAGIQVGCGGGSQTTLGTGNGLGGDGGTAGDSGTGGNGTGGNGTGGNGTGGNGTGGNGTGGNGTGGDGGSTSCEDPIIDGEFQTTTAWSVKGGAAIDTAAPGYAAVLGVAQMLGGDDWLKRKVAQTVQMPTVAECQAARIEYFVLPEYSGAAGILDGATGIGPHWHSYQHHFWGSAQWWRVSRCLGASAYGGATEIALALSGRGVLDAVKFDAVRVIYGAEAACPDVGKVLNGDFESGDGFGWTTDSGGTIGQVSAAAAGEGVGGSYAATITLPNEYSRGRLSGLMSVPLPAAMPHPALRYVVKLTSGVRAHAVVNGTRVPIDGTGAFLERRVCLPVALGGGVYDVEFELQGSTPFDAANGQKLIVDDLTVVEDASCVTANGLLDPGLEASRVDSTRYGWWFSTGGTASAGSPLAEAQDGAAHARTGSGSLHLALDQKCTEASAGQSFSVPMATASEGPALTFWYKYPKTTASALILRGPTGERTSLTIAAGYTSKTVCLPPEYAGRTASFAVTLSSSGTCADVLDPPDEAWFDDFAVGTSAHCPAE
jgi:hypothetical protein